MSNFKYSGEKNLNCAFFYRYIIARFAKSAKSAVISPAMRKKWQMRPCGAAPHFSLDKVKKICYYKCTNTVNE